MSPSRKSYPGTFSGDSHRIFSNARLYGTRAPRIMGDLGEHFGGTLYRAEIDYLCQAEWAKTAADILDRRTKHGLRLTAPQRARVAAYLNTST